MENNEKLVIGEIVLNEEGKLELNINLDENLFNFEQMERMQEAISLIHECIYEVFEK